MPKMHNRSGHGTRYAITPSPRVIGPCQEFACNGELRVAWDKGVCVIACHLCPAVWIKHTWPVLAALLEEEAQP